jgi:hypothetical protein
MFSAILSFFGGNVFRMIWGEVSNAWTAYQDHKQQLQMMELQGRLDAEKAERNMKAMQLQADLKLQVVKVEAENQLADIDATNFGKAVEATGKMTGVKWVDAWNGLVRPLAATECLLLWSFDLYHKGFAMDDRSWELAGAILGIYVADRALFRRGK